MKLSTFWKGLIMAIIGFVATTIGTLDPFNLSYIIIASVAFTLIYFGKNYWLPSTSEAGEINWRDIVSGLIIAVGMAISSFSASIILTGVVDWKALFIAVIGAVVGYFGKTIPQKQ
jgi:uncharacterized membrane protein